MGKIFKNAWLVAIIAAVLGSVLMYGGLFVFSGIIAGIVTFVGGIGVTVFLFVAFRAWVGDPIGL